MADLWEAIAAAQPEAPVFEDGAASLSWRDFDQQADGLAEGLVAAGLGVQDGVGFYRLAGRERLVGAFATFKAGLRPVAVAGRETPDTHAWAFQEAQVAAVVFDTRFTAEVEALRQALPGVRLWIACVRLGPPTPDWAVDYDDLGMGLVVQAPFCAPWDRSMDDALQVCSRREDGTLRLQTVTQETLQSECETLARRILRARPVETVSAALRRALRLQDGCGPLCLSNRVPCGYEAIRTWLAALSLGGSVVMADAELYATAEARSPASAAAEGAILTRRRDLSGAGVAWRPDV